MKYLGAFLLFVLIVGVPLLHAVSTDRETRNFRAVTPGTLYRSGQMTPAGFERVLREYKIGTVISLRESRDPDKPSHDEFEAEICKQKGVRYERLIPMRWSTPDGDVPAKENVAKFVKLVRDRKTPTPILVHCFAGIHRTGAFVAIYRVDREGWSNDDAIVEMMEIGGSRASFEQDQVDFLKSFRPPPVEPEKKAPAPPPQRKKR